MSLAHGILLHDQGKLEQAEKAYREHLSQEPNDDYAHSRLALCLLEQTGRKRDALEEIDRSIKLEPNHDYYHAVRSIILSSLNRGAEALEAAESAITINPEASFNHTAKASALSDLMRWSDAENSLRQALTLDSDNAFAKNLLASVLQNQGKRVESEFATDQLLADDPESAFAHANAGWTALRRHDHPEAEKHFRESLRLDAEFEMAREGLLESFKARSWFYRAYLRYTFFMARFTGGKQWMIILGMYFAYQVTRHLLKDISPIAGGVVVILWLSFVLWIWLANGIGSFLVLCDRSARHALKPPEKRLGLAIGGSLILGIAGIISGLALSITSLFVVGFALLCSTVPAALTFSNPSKKGRLVFGAIFAYVYLAGVFGAVMEYGNTELEKLNEFTVLVGAPAFLLALLCTWIGNIRSLREDDSE